jgi:hypothetical protein
MATDPNSKPRRRLDDKLFREEFFRANGLGADIGETDELMRQASANSPAAKPRPSTGYANPPVETRFVKGKSGNPNGRPKGSAKSKAAASAPYSSVDDIRRRLAATPIKVREGNELREVHVVEALSRQIDKLAFAGGIQATRLALERHEHTLRQVEAERQEDADWASSYRSKYEAQCEALERAGKPVPDWMLRPEDVHFSYEKGLRIMGPYDEESYESFLRIKQWRDAFHIKMIYDSDVFFSKLGVRVSMTMAEFFVLTLELRFPERWKLGSEEMREREALLIWGGRQRLAQKLIEAFAALGFPAPLSKPTPPVPDKILRAFGINPREMRQRFSGQS